MGFRSTASCCDDGDVNANSCPLLADDWGGGGGVVAEDLVILTNAAAVATGGEESLPSGSVREEGET